MGFRYRKSIHLGGGIRINISKSGIGYSWGVKGYRISKDANGVVRKTASIPGTGISYTVQSKKHTQQASPAKSPKIAPASNNLCECKEYKNENASQISSDGLEVAIASVRKTILTDMAMTILSGLTFVLGLIYPAFFVLFAVFLLLKIYTRISGTVDMEYDIDKSQKDIIAQRMDAFMKIANSKKLWRVVQSNQVIDTKYTGGAVSSLKRETCRVMEKAPFPFKTNEKVLTFKMSGETLAFFPDKLFLISGMNVGAISYDDLSFSISNIRFVEDQTPPSDASVVDKTWQYVNKSGGPDRRFKNNRQLPVCLYGKIWLKSPLGVNTIILYSNADICD